MFGAGGGTSSYREIEETDVVLLWGSNARETHPIFFHHLLKGVHAEAVFGFAGISLDGNPGDGFSASASIAPATRPA